MTFRHRPGCNGPDLHLWTGQRGDPMATCPACKANGPAPAPPPPPSNWTLNCIDCQKDFPVYRLRPRKPLCQACHDTRQHQAAYRRRQRAELVQPAHRP